MGKNYDGIFDDVFESFFKGIEDARRTTQDVYFIPVKDEPRVRTVGNITLEFLQECVGGYIEPCAPVELKERGIELLANEEGLLSGLEPNRNLFPFFLVGNVIAVGVDGEDFTGLTDYQRRFMEGWVKALKEC